MVVQIQTRVIELFLNNLRLQEVD